MNAKKKGQKKELLCAHELQAEGYLIAFRSYTIKMGPIYKGIDFADSFDVIGIRRKLLIPNGIPVPSSLRKATWKLVSCTYEGNASARRILVQAFARDYALPGMSCELWVWYPSALRGRGKSRKWTKAHWQKEIVA